MLVFDHRLVIETIYVRRGYDQGMNCNHHRLDHKLSDDLEQNGSNKILRIENDKNFRQLINEILLVFVHKNRLIFHRNLRDLHVMSIMHASIN